MKRLTWRLAACVVVFAAGVAGPARADVLYSNLGPGESYQQNGGLIESGPNTILGPFRQGFAFTVGGTDTVFDSARLALGLISGANEMDLRLYNDVNGRPNTVIEAMHLSGQMPIFAMYGSGHLVESDSALHPLLQSGGTYWLVPFAFGDTDVGWNYNTQGGSGPDAFSFDVEPTSWGVVQGALQGAYEVNGTPSPAPEPSGLALAGVGLVGMVGFAWRRRRATAA
jgi:MYXO-CTERM domain-containing protein